MRSFARNLVTVLSLTTLVVAVRPTKADTPPAGTEKSIMTNAYDAVIAPDGCMSSLRIEGREFLANTKGVPRGAYLYQGTLLVLDQIERPAPNIISARNDQAALRYEFGPNAIKVTIANGTEKNLAFYSAFDAGVNAVVTSQGDVARPMVNQKQQPETTWFNESSKLKLTGGNRIWGPFANKFQIWEATVAPHETRTIVFEAGKATDAEVQRNAALPAAVPAQP